MDPSTSKADKSASVAHRRHSTFRQRARFAAPVVLIVTLASACGADDSVDVTNPATSTTLSANPAVAVSNPPPVGDGRFVVTTLLPPATTPADDTPIVIANPPPPTYVEEPIVTTPTTVPGDSGVVVISNPPPPGY